MAKWVWLFLAVSIFGNGIGLYLLDRALEYREQVNSLEASFVNEGLHLVDEEAIAQLEDKPVAACIGGSLFRYWHLPTGGLVHFVNQGRVEEKTAATLQRMDTTVLAIAADRVYINAGFCALHTAVYAGRDIADTQQSIFETVATIVEKARRHGVVPILTTLTPVRPRVVFPYTGLIEYDKTMKRKENQAIAELNAMLKKYAQEQDVPVIDFHAALVDDSGRLRQEFALQDGEHLNWKGYRELDRVLSDRGRQA